MPTLRVGDNLMSYDDYGSGPVVVLIHGSPGNSKAWLRVGERLADRFRIIAPDLPGYGVTTPQSSGAAPDTTHAVELIEALISSVGSPVVLAGHSYGGVVALAVALRQCIPIGALVLFEPVALRVLSVVGEVATYERTKAFFDDYLSRFEGGDHQAIRMIIDFWHRPGAFDQMPDPVKAYLLKETAKNTRDVRATFREEYSLSAFGKLAVPILTVCGTRSPAVTQQIAKTIAAHTPMGSFVSLENADHALTTTHVEAVAETISYAAANAAQLQVERKGRKHRAIAGV